MHLGSRPDILAGFPLAGLKSSGELSSLRKTTGKEVKIGKADGLLTKALTHI
jgi:hypothetical protein